MAINGEWDDEWFCLCLDKLDDSGWMIVSNGALCLDGSDCGWIVFKD